MAELLVNKGANVDVPDKWGDTPLMLAAFGCKVDLVKLLLRLGANATKAVGEVELGKKKGKCSKDSDADDIERLLQQK